MKKHLKNIIFGGLFAFLVASPVLAVTSPQVSTVSADPKCERRVLGIPPWYRGLTGSYSACEIKTPAAVGSISQFIWTIVLNIIEMAIVIVAYISAFFILYGGFLFMTGGSNPGQIEKARKSILNAVIGLVIAMGSIAIVNQIFSLITSTNSLGISTMSGEALLVNALNLTYFIAGVIAVIVIVFAGIMYTTSSGDAGRVTKAKNLLTYSIVGLIVVMTAFAITNFVIGRFN